MPLRNQPTGGSSAGTGASKYALSHPRRRPPPTHRSLAGLRPPGDRSAPTWEVAQTISNTSSSRNMGHLASHIDRKEVGKMSNCAHPDECRKTGRKIWMLRVAAHIMELLNSAFAHFHCSGPEHLASPLKCFCNHPVLD